MRRHFGLIVIITLLGLSGCGAKPGPNGEGNPQGRMPRAPQEAPPAPPRKDVPFDPQLGEQADREISADLHSSSPLDRAHALEAIRAANLLEHQQDIITALKDPEPIVRFAAAMAAGELKLQAARQPLLAVADDPSEDVRVAVRFALHRLGDKHLSHDLEKMAADSSPSVRGNTAMVLGMLHEPSALPILRQLRLDSNAAVRQQASEAMWRLGNEDGLKDLIGLTLSRYPDDQMIGYLALAWPRVTTVRQHIRGGLVGDYAEVTLVAARAMGMLGSDEGYAVAAKGAQSSDPRQRLLAALAFGAIGRLDAQEILRKLLSDADAGVRIAAATAILQLKPAGKT